MLCAPAFMFGVRQNATITAVSDTACLVIHKDSFKLICKDYPDAAGTGRPLPPTPLLKRAALSLPIT